MNKIKKKSNYNYHLKNEKKAILIFYVIIFLINIYAKSFLIILNFLINVKNFYWNNIIF